MTLPIRHSLPHNVPLWVDPQKEVYFITITCRHRGLTQLTRPEVAGPLLDTVKLRNDRFIWFAYVFLLMPDHVHALLSFPPSRNAGQRAKWESRGSVIFSNIAFVQTKAGARRRITSWQIPFAKD